MSILNERFFFFGSVVTTVGNIPLWFVGDANYRKVLAIKPNIIIITWHQVNTIDVINNESTL